MFARLMGLKTVSPEGLQQLIGNGQVTVVDVNSPQSWATARVPGAIHLDPLAYRESDLPRDSRCAPRLLLFELHVQKSAERGSPGEADGLYQRAGHVRGDQRVAQCKAADGERSALTPHNGIFSTTCYEQR